MAGNVVTAQGVADLARAGAHSIKVGVGSGSICTTRIVAGSGYPQLSALWDCAPAALEHGVTICLLYTSAAAAERSSVDLVGRRIIKKKKTEQIEE